MTLRRGAFVSVVGFLSATAVVAAGAAATRAVGESRWDPTGEMAAYGAFYEKPVWAFAVLMGATVTVVAATVIALWRARLLIPAVGTAVGAGIGPMALVAFPIWETPDTMAMERGAESLLFGALFLAVMITITAAVSAWLDPDLKDRPAPSWRITGLYLMLAALGVLVFTELPSLMTNEGATPLGYPMVCGWVLVCAGIIVAGVFGRETRTSTAVRSMVWMAVPLGMAAVMNRPGGAPEAPGWEWAEGLPQYLTVPITAMVIGSAVIGWGLSAAPWRTSDRSPAPPPAHPAPVA